MPRLDPSLARSAEAGSVPSFRDWLPLVTPRWKWDWPHLCYIQDHLDKVTTGEIKKIMLFMPPRHGKSEQTTIRYPAWRLEANPELRVCVGCYNKTFAGKFGRKARRIARERMPLSSEKNTANEWETEQGGVYRSCGVGSPPTGEGFDLLIIDDPIKSREEAESLAYRERTWDWYCDDLYTRLEPGAAIILVQTRWHVDDLAGRILKSEDGPNWTVINLPAEAEDNDPLGRPPGEPLCPARYDKAALADRLRVMGPASYTALFQGRPFPREGNLFKRQWWVRYRWMGDHYVLSVSGAQIFPRNCLRIAIMDPAGGTSEGANRTAIAFWDVCLGGLHAGKALLRHAFAERVPVEEIPKKLKELCDVHRPFYVLVEAEFLQHKIVTACRKLYGMPAIKAIKTEGKNKYVRAVPAILKASAGELIIPEDNHYPWVEPWLLEHGQFTGNNDLHDDQVDCTSYLALDMQQGVSAGALPMAVGEKYQ